MTALDPPDAGPVRIRALGIDRKVGAGLYRAAMQTRNAAADCSIIAARLLESGIDDYSIAFVQATMRLHVTVASDLPPDIIAELKLEQV